MSPGEQPLNEPDRLVRVAATQLYAGVPAEFVAARTALVKSAKAQGEKEAAARIGALRRPSVAAWVLNQLVHRADPVIEELGALGEQLRHATSTLDAAGIAQLRPARDEVLASLVTAAGRVAAEAGQRLTAAVEAEVRDTGIAALADEAAEGVLRSGTLTRALSYSGFGEVDVSEAAATTSTGVVLTSIPGGRADRPSPDKGKEDVEVDEDLTGAKDEGEPGETDVELDGAQALAEAEEAVERERAIIAAQEAVEAASREVGRRRASVDAARNRTEATRARIQKLEHQLEAARTEDEEALEKLTTAVGDAKRAETELAEARERLAEMQGSPTGS